MSYFNLFSIGSVTKWLICDILRGVCAILTYIMLMSSDVFVVR